MGTDFDRRADRFIIVARANQLPNYFYLSMFSSTLIDAVVDWYAQLPTPPIN